MTSPIVPAVPPAVPSPRGRAGLPPLRRRGHLVAAEAKGSAAVSALRHALLSAVGHCPPGGSVTVDVGALSRCSDAGIAVLREALSAAAAHGIELRMTGPDSAVCHALGLIDVGGWHVAAR